MGVPHNYTGQNRKWCVCYKGTFVFKYSLHIHVLYSLDGLCMYVKGMRGGGEIASLMPAVTYIINCITIEKLKDAHTYQLGSYIVFYHTMLNIITKTLV